MRIVGSLIVLAVALGACQTALLDPQGLLDTQGKTEAGPASVAEIIADMHDVSPRNAVRALRKRGFKPYSDKGLKGKMAGKTLQIAATYGFYGKDGTVRVRDTGGGGRRW